MAWVALTSNMMLWPLAKEAGYFEKYGLNVDLQYINGSGVATQSLVAGAIDFVSEGASGMVSAAAGGADIVMIAGYLNVSPYRVMVMPGINSFNDLKSKRIAVGRIANSDYLDMLKTLELNGVQSTDVQFVSMGDEPGKIAALRNGQAQATIVTPPNDLLAERAGAHLLLDLALGEPQQGTGMVVTRKFLATNRPAIVAATKASIAAIARWRSDPAFAMGVIKKYLKEEDQAFIERGYDAYTDAWTRVPYPSTDGLATVIARVALENPQAKNLKPDQLMDVGVVKELEDSGFIKQAYGTSSA
jgi:NitT/TauT family transport system substrate-binding protein